VADLAVLSSLWLILFCLSTFELLRSPMNIPRTKRKFDMRLRSTKRRFVEAIRRNPRTFQS
jgi:hypothetical protein